MRRLVALVAVVWACSCGVQGPVAWLTLWRLGTANAAKPHVDKPFAIRYARDWNRLGGDRIVTIGCVLVPASKATYAYEACVARVDPRKGKGYCAALKLLPVYDSPQDAILGGQVIDCTHVPTPQTSRLAA
jgi:hypothetical protein